MIKLRLDKQHGVMETLNIPLEVWNFPAGEVGIKLPNDINKIIQDNVGPNSNFSLTIRFLYESSDDIILLMNLMDILSKVDCPKSLVMPYMPYGRQDRICHVGESFSLKIFANIINSMNFNNVITFDTHSLVTDALFNNIQVFTQDYCLTRTVNVSEYDYIVIPDIGASKKIKLNNTIQCIKERVNDEVKIKVLDVNKIKSNTKLLVVDDICDGGATFIELAKVLPSCAKLDLYVTHGIFSKGKDTLLSYYNEIFCFNNQWREVNES